jgi:vacuolar-type H+-ATPase subunit H
MNEKRIQQVLEIEKQAQQLFEAATREAQQLPITADQEAQQLIEEARAAAQEEARQMVEKAQAVDEAARIMTEAQEKTRLLEKLTAANLDRAVAYVLEQVIGKE